jgi:hypothetical protein
MQLNSEQNVPSAHQQAIEAPSTGESPTDQIAHPPEWLGFVAGDSAAEASILSGIVIHGNVGEAKNGTAEQTGAIDAASPILEVPAVEESTLVGLLDAVIPIDVSGLSAAVMDVLSQLNAVYADVESMLPETKYAIALLGVAAGLTGYEVTRRRRQALTAPVALPSSLPLEPT